MKTAIELLIEQAKDFKFINYQDAFNFTKLLYQAKQMEKEQIIDAFFEGKNDGILMERYSDYNHISPDEFYNKTFKSE
jgi:hypothetical protein